MRRLIHVGGDLIDTRQRVQHFHVTACALKIAGAQDELRLDVGVLRRIKTLFLHAGHIQNIHLGHHLFDAGVQAPRDAFLIEHIEDVLRHRQRVRGDEVEAVAVELRQRLRQGVDGAAIFQVADHGDVQVLQTALGLLNGEQIQQGLGRMLVSAIPGVQHRNAAGELGRQTRGALLRVTHHDGINVGADHRDGIREGLAFFPQRGVAAVGEAHDACAQTVDRGLERQAGTGGGFKEAAGDHLVLQQLRLRVGFQFCRGFKNQLQLFTAEVVDGNDVFLIKRIHFYLLTPGKKKPLK